MRQINDFHEAFEFIASHSKFMAPILPEDDSPKESLIHELYIMVVKVNPNGEYIDNDPSLNVKTKVWLEYGPAHYCEHSNRWTSSHDYALDSGGDTFEQAVIEMANLIIKNYGDDSDA